MFYWWQVKPFENLWIMDLYKFGLYSWIFSCKIEPCPLPVENGSAKCGLQCEAVEDPHLAPHHHATCGLFASFDLEFTGRKRKLVWRLKRNPELLCVCKIFQCQMSPIPFHLKYNMQKQVTKVIDHHCYKTCCGRSITNCDWLYIMQNFIMNYPLCISIECKRSIHTLWDMSQGKSLSLR